MHEPKLSRNEAVEQLFLWARDTERGLCRAEFVTEPSRREVERALAVRLATEGIPLQRIEIPSVLSPADLGRYLTNRLAGLAPGVVSITGLATLFPPGVDIERALGPLGSYRELLATPPLRQIWWMPTVFARHFVRAVPDLDSWFLFGIRLEEGSRGREQIRERGARPSPPGPPRRRSGWDAEDDEGDLGREGAAQATQAEVASATSGTGSSAHAERRYDQAERAFRLAYRQWEKAVGAEHPEVAATLVNLGKVYLDTGRLEEAEHALRRAEALLSKALGKLHPRTRQAQELLDQTREVRGTFQPDGG